MNLSLVPKSVIETSYWPLFWPFLNVCAKFFSFLSHIFITSNIVTIIAVNVNLVPNCVNEGQFWGGLRPSHPLMPQMAFLRNGSYLFIWSSYVIVPLKKSVPNIVIKPWTAP